MDGAPVGSARGPTMTDIAADERIRRDYPALAEAAAVVGSVQIRNRATLAGNICNASPAADTAPALLVYGARVVVAGPAGDAGAIPIDDVLRPVRRHDARARRARLGDRAAAAGGAARGSVHVRRTRRRGHDLASVTLACAVDAGRASRGSRTAASVRGRCSWSTRPASSPMPAAPDDAIATRASRRCSPTRARRRDRCARAPSTGSRCSGCSACARSDVAIERLAAAVAP